MIDQRLSDLGPQTRDDVQNPRRQPGALHDLPQFKRGQRSMFGRFQDHRAARGQCGCHFPGRHQERVVPRDDRRRHADGFTDDLGREALIRQGYGLSLAVQLLGQTRVKLKAARRIAKVPFGLGQGFAVVDHFQPRQFRQAIADAPRDGPQNLSPFGPRQAWPRAMIKGSAGGLDGGVRVRCRCRRDMVHHRFGGRIDHRQGAASDRGNPSAVDEKLSLHGSLLRTG